MTTRRSPDGQIYTEVPVVPRHDQLDGRSLGNSHPIEAITGLRDELDGKVDAVDGKGLSTEDFTTAEKEKLASYEPSPIRLIKVDGLPQEIDAEGAVDLTMYWEQMGRSLAWDDASGKLILRNDWGMDLSRAALPCDGVTAAAYDQATGRLNLTLHDGSTVYADLSPLDQEYTAGNGLRLTGHAFALTEAVATAVSAASDHVATDSVHVSAADRSKWNGVDNAVKVTGDQTVAGAKTFTGAVVVPTPQAASQAATKAYVDSVAGGGGGGSGPWTSVGVSEYTEAKFNTLFTAGGQSDIYVAQKDVMIYIVAYIGSSSSAYVESAVYIPKGTHVPSRLDFIRGHTSARVDMYLRLPVIFNVSGASGVISTKVVESITSSGVSVTVVNGAQSLTLTEVPYTLLSSGWDNTKNTLCIQYR